MNGRKRCSSTREWEKAPRLSSSAFFFALKQQYVKKNDNKRGKMSGPDTVLAALGSSLGTFPFHKCENELKYCCYL